MGQYSNKGLYNGYKKIIKRENKMTIMQPRQPR